MKRLKIMYLLVVLLTASFVMASSNRAAQAANPQIPGNPGVPGLLAEIERLEQVVESQNTTIGELQTDINYLESEINSLNGEITYLQAEIANLQTVIRDLQESDMMQNFAPVPRTGWTEPDMDGDDGSLQKGVVWPSIRFTDNSDGTVTDNLTGLIWMQNAGALGSKSWGDALVACNTLASGIYGLSDGSQAAQWRLPNVRELLSLIDYGKNSPSLPDNHPFVGAQSYYHWSSTAFYIPFYAWLVDLTTGKPTYYDNTLRINVWCVRGGE
jgi:hypothetical protein